MKTKKLKFSLLNILLFLFIIGCTKDENDEDRTHTAALNNLSLGASANDLLSDEKYTSLAIEVVYVKGYEPTKAALQQLKVFLQDHTYKPEGISVIKRAIDAPGGESYSISEIVDIEEQNRSLYTSGKKIAVFILFADGEKTDDEEKDFVLGSAYMNTSIVIYGKTIQELASKSMVPRSDIESSTLMHEFGHLFGLVDNGSPAQSSHEDPENDAHCNSDGCLMLAKVEFGMGTLALLKRSKNRNERVGFDEKCLMDLKANGGK